MAKRMYVKPELLYENFILAQHIAACYYHTNSTDKQSCSVNDIGGGGNPGSLLIDGQFKCLNLVEEEFCYTNGTEENRIFAS